MDCAQFYGVICPALLGGSLSPLQVERIECLLDAIDEAVRPLAGAAYAFATAPHETAKWQHLKELGGQSYFTSMYDKGRGSARRRQGPREYGGWRWSALCGPRLCPTDRPDRSRWPAACC